MPDSSMYCPVGGFDESVLWQMLPLGICVLDRNFVVHGWNRQLEAWTSLPFEAVRGRRLCEIFPEFRPEKFRGRVQQVFDSGVPTVLSSVLHNHFLPIRMSAQPDAPLMVQETRILRLAGEASRIVVSMDDMTTTVRQQEKLRRDRIFLLQTQQALEAANTSLQASLRQIAASNEKLQAEIQERKQVEIDLRRQTNEFIASKAREAEHRNRLEQLVRELTTARYQAEAAVRAKSEFLANMSHEIRTPMTAILGYVDLLEDPEISQDQQTQARQAIRRSGDHLLEIIRDILDISKIEAGKLQVQLEPVAVREIVEDVVKMMQGRATEHKLDLRLEPIAPLPVMMRSDPLRLRQILVNLVGNAVKFTHQGSVTVRMRWLESDSDKARLLIEVADTGIGIHPDAREKLFQPFVQVDSRLTRQFGGTGLGLAISQRLAQFLGGDIRVESEVDRGSTFTVDLPCPAGFARAAAAACARADVHDSNSNSNMTAPIALQGMRVLVVDDAADNRKLLSFHLRKAGAEIDLAENGQLALDLIAALDGKPYDVVLMDMQMPVLDGYEATRQLRNRGDQTPVIAVTAHAMQGDREKCLDAGCSDYLSKPIQRERLIALTAYWAQKSLALQGQ